MSKIKKKSIGFLMSCVVKMILMGIIALIVFLLYNNIESDMVKIVSTMSAIVLSLALIVFQFHKFIMIIVKNRGEEKIN